MRYSCRAIFIFFLLFALFCSLPLIADQSIFIDPENPPEVVTVRLGSDFNLTLEGTGWYLNRYDRSLLSFRLRRVESFSTIFVMHSLEEGTANLVLSLKLLDIPLVVMIARGSEDIEEKGMVLHDEELAEKAQQESGKVPSISEKAEALKERGLVEDQEMEDRPEDIVEGAEGKQSGEKPMPKEDRVIPTRKNEMAQAEPDKDELYYVDEDNRIVKVPHAHEEDFFRRGRRYYQKGEHGEARAELQLYLSRCEKCTKVDNARLLLADISLQLRDEEGALAQLNEVIESGKEAAVLSALEIRADIHYSAERYGDALADYESIYNRGGGGDELVQRLGDMNYALHHEGEALHWYEEGIAKGVASDETIFRVATLYDSPGGARDIEKAYEYYRLITEKYRSSVHFEAALQRVQFFENHFFNYY
jgi:TolA-binding protein